MDKINWWQPQVGKEEFELVRKVLESNYINDGDITDSFEEELSRLLGCRYVIAVTNGTAALFLALYAMGVGPGDEVIVPDVTFIATANAVTMTGARPVLVDIDPETMNMDTEAFSSAINDRTKAVVPVHVSGRSADMDKILSISRQRRIKVVEDAAEAFMSMRDKKCLGTFADAGIFSFSPNKTVTTGQGGAVVTDDRQLFEKISALKDQGRSVRGTGGNDIHDTVGFNFKLTNLQAAVGLGQLSYLDERVSRMRRIYEIYSDTLSGISQVRLFRFDIKGGEVPQWTDITLEKRDELHDHLEKNGICCRKYWYPVHSQKPYFQDDVYFPESTKMCGKTMWLPSSFLLEDNDAQRVCTVIKGFFK